MTGYNIGGMSQNTYQAIYKFAENDVCGVMPTVTIRCEKKNKFYVLPNGDWEEVQYETHEGIKREVPYYSSNHYAAAKAAADLLMPSIEQQNAEVARNEAWRNDWRSRSRVMFP